MAECFDIKAFDELQEDLFIPIEDNNEEQISFVCASLLLSYMGTDAFERIPQKEFLNEIKEMAGQVTGYDFLRQFVGSLPKPMTIVQEIYHVDAAFRDSYYMYFSNQHFEMSRFSKRLSFFAGHVTEKDFISYSSRKKKYLQDCFLGTMVLNPLKRGAIGKTLIAAEYALKKNEKPAYIRMSNYKVHIRGREFQVWAFPYRMQDQETMTCAEVTILNMLDYYSNTYQDYHVVTPSQIIYQEASTHYERVLPSRGMTYSTLTRIMTDFGFSPRLYSTAAMKANVGSALTKEKLIKRVMHYYIESGIPVAVNVAPKETVDGPLKDLAAEGHSLICIGHGPKKYSLIETADAQAEVSFRIEGEKVIVDEYPLVDAADYYEDYVVVDDNSPIYHLRPYQCLVDRDSLGAMSIDNLSVPLYKRMFLDAMSAQDIFRSILNDNGIEGYYGLQKWLNNEYNQSWVNENLKVGERIVTRLFMASSRSYKKFRSEHAKDKFLRKAYSGIPMPRFVWVCELYTEKEFLSEKPVAFAEIVIDAISAPVRGRNGVILMRYPCSLGFRIPEQTTPEFAEVYELKAPELLAAYSENLRFVN